MKGKSTPESLAVRCLLLIACFIYSQYAFAQNDNALQKRLQQINGLIKQRIDVNAPFRVDLTGQPAGVYTMKLQSRKGSDAYKLIVK